MKQQFTGTCSLRPARTEIPGPAPAPPTAQQWLTGILTGRRHRRRSRALLERVVLSEAWGSQGYRAESRRGERPEPPWPWWATETPEPLAKSPSLCARKDAPKLKQTHANRVHSSIAHSGREERVSRLWSSHTVEPRVCVCVCVCVCTRTHAHACVPSLSVMLDSLQPTDCRPPVHGIFRARILEWVAASSSRRSSRPRDQTHVSCVSCTGMWTLPFRHMGSPRGTLFSLK